MSGDRADRIIGIRLGVSPVAKWSQFQGAMRDLVDEVDRLGVLVEKLLVRQAALEIMVTRKPLDG